MIKILRLVKIHPVLWFILGAGGLAGMFKEMLMLLFIVFVHELGHAASAAHYGWRIRRIMLMPFGGVAEVDEYGNRPVQEEIVVTIMGPLQHVWMIGLSFAASGTYFWSAADHRIFLFHNLSILLFNLLPVIPLDGGRLLFAFNSLRFSFFKSYHMTFRLSGLFLSLLTLVTLFILPFHLNLLIIISFLWLHQYLEWKQRHYHFLRFLLERQRTDVKKDIRFAAVSPHMTVAEAVKLIRRETELAIKMHGEDKKHVINESVLLNAYFNRKKQNLPLGELM